jgi:hypothetical protein
VAVLYGLALVTAYSAGVYFLFPYYSIQPGETHFNGPVPMAWADGEYLLSLKSTRTRTHAQYHTRTRRTRCTHAQNHTRTRRTHARACPC